MTNPNSTSHPKLDEALSAFFDGEARPAEAHELLDRLCRDAQLRATLDRHQRLRASLRGELHPGLDEGFAGRVMAAIDAEVSEPRKLLTLAAARRSRPVRVVFGLAMAASLAAVTVLSMRTLLPSTDATFPVITATEPEHRTADVTEIAATATTNPSTQWNDLSADEIAELNDYLISHNNSAMDLGLNGTFGFMRVAAQEGDEFAE